MAPKRARRTLVRPTRQETAAARALVGPLRDSLIQPTTRVRYRAAVDRYLSFLGQLQLPSPPSMPQLDGSLCQFIEYLWKQGDAKAIANDSLSGLAHFLPAVRRQTPEAWRLVGAWSRLELPARAPPFTAMFVYAIAQYCVERSWRDTMVLLVLGWATYPRSGELFGCEKRDFALDPVRGVGVWSLPLTKAGQRRGVAESINIDDEWVVRLLFLYLAPLRPEDRLSRVAPATQPCFAMVDKRPEGLQRHRPERPLSFHCR